MYNSMSALPYIPYKIMEYLATSKADEAEIFWKMLAYNDYDALSKPNLTTTQKLNLLWRYGPQEKYGVFLTNIVGDVVPTAKCIFKCYDYYIHASSLFVGTTVMAFDMLYGTQMALVDYNGVPVSRGDLFIHCILSVLNGVYVGGVGTLAFLNNQSRYDLARSVIGNSNTYTGVQLFMSVDVGDGGADDGCGED